MNILDHSITKRSQIAASTHTYSSPEIEEIWPSDVRGKDVDHPYMYIWIEDMGPCLDDGVHSPVDRWGTITAASAWSVQELRKPPRKFQEAELGWYVVHIPFSGINDAVAGPYGTWEEAADKADSFGTRDHIYR